MPSTTQLIPGLPDDLSRDCLLRLKFPQFPAAAAVCRSWNSEFHLPDFSHLRKLSSTAQNLFVFAQARVDHRQRYKYRSGPNFRLTVFEPSTGLWSELPPPPVDSLPMFCQVAGVGSDLVLLGGLDPDTWQASSLVFVFSFLTGTWRQGTDIPGHPRSFFGCASDQNRRMVFVAGGHDGEKNALKSSLAYDVIRDEWVPLPDMARERDECKAIFHRGRLHVIGGYCTEMQGRFERGAEVFDSATWKWGPVEDGFLETAACPRSCPIGGDEDGGGRVLYMCRRGEVVARRNDTWRSVAVLPDDMRRVEYVAAWEEGKKMLVVGSGEPRQVYTLDLKTLAWEKLETPAEYSGHVHGGCLVEI